MIYCSNYSKYHGGQLVSTLELFEVIAENAEAMQEWNISMHAAFAQEYRENALSVTL